MCFKYKFATIDWKDEINPKSTIFDDIYFSTFGGKEETIHNFLKGNNLYNRFNQIPQESNFYIAETGFGTGSNLTILITELKETIIKRNLKIHFISFEKYPLHPDDLIKFYTNTRNKNEIIAEFIEKYRISLNENNVFSLLSNHVVVKLIIGDINQTIELFSKEYANRIDAWFLDGFAPSKNPEMWNDKIFNKIYESSKQGTTLSSFTVAGVVRRGLQNSGFSVKKIPGSGQKKEILFAQKEK